MLQISVPLKSQRALLTWRHATQVARSVKLQNTLTGNAPKCRPLRSAQRSRRSPLRRART
jgi:hypothetical protein